MIKKEKKNGVKENFFEPNVDGTRRWFGSQFRTPFC